jgi:hypothetical protein
MKSCIVWDASALLVTCFHTGLLLGSFFDPEDGKEMFFQNVR